MNAYNKFPADNTKKRAIIMVNSDNLVSATFDGIHLSKLFNDILHFDNINILANAQDSLDKIKAKTGEYKNITLTLCKTKSVLLSNLSLLLNNDENIVFVMSSHGYAHGDTNYIKYMGELIYDYEWNKTIQTSLHENAHCLTLVDACQSGTELNLNYKTSDLITYSYENKNVNNTKKIICISSVSDTEYDEDNVSELGFGGGLTSAYIDYCYEHKNNIMTIHDFFIYYQNRMKKCGKHSLLSFNCVDFMKKH